MRPRSSTRMPSCTASPAAFASASSGTAPAPTTMRSAASVSLALVTTASLPSGSACKPAQTVPVRMSTPWSRWRWWMIAEVSSSHTRARMRGAISITVTLMPSSAAEAAISSPTTPPPIRISDFARLEMRLQRQRLVGGAQIVDAGLAFREHRQDAVARAGRQHQRVVGDALAGFGRPPRGRRGRSRCHARGLERDVRAGDALRPGDRRVLRHRLAGEHGLRQRRLLVGLDALVVDAA